MDYNGWAIEVRDNGAGLPPKARERLFRPFEGSARPGGTGLGLAFALQEIGPGGASFLLLLPAMPAAAE
jgi:signal transduction histidine kinase